jgi:hypothetical protein
MIISPLKLEGMKEKHLPEIETRYDDLVGGASVNFKQGINFEEFAHKVVNMDPQKYEPLLMRVYMAHQPVVTVYARRVDDRKTTSGNDKVLVEKFKAQLSLEEFFSYFEQIDFSFSAGGFDVNHLEVRK